MTQWAGHDDLRQDERVVQLFSLVNGLLSFDAASSRRNLYIRDFPVIPVGVNAGLIGWVQETDPLHDLVKEHRNSRGILLK